MTNPSAATSSKRVLEPIDRISEVLFGLIMVLTFSGSLSVAEAGREDVRTMLIGALGCNLAWGIIDGLLYLMQSVAERGRAAATLRALRDAPDAERAQPIIAGAVPPLLASVLQPAEFASLYERLKQLPEPPMSASARKDDILGAVGVFLLVFLSTFPVVIPFLVMGDAHRALRVSNLIAIVMLFLTGYAYGRLIGWHQWLVGILMVIVGAVLAGITMALGG
jgi:hypothetical protein